MRNLVIERIYYSATQKMYLPSLNIFKRIGVILALFAFSYILMLSWRPGISKQYNKWKFNRYVSSSSENVVNGKENRQDYMFQFLAKIMSDKKSMFHICDELDVISCMNISGNNDDSQEIKKRSFKDCAPRKKVAFLKTHKCASTTIQNILLRFGKNNNLNFVLPSQSHLLGTNVPFRRNMLQGTMWEQAGLEYDLFLLHTIWNHPEIAHTLSDKGDVLYISILRDPVELFRSWWDYMRLDNRYKKTIDEYALSIRSNSIVSTKERPFGFNQMLFDFGLPFEDMNDEHKIQKKIEEVDESFDLILLADKPFFQDSIILLKDALCWEYRDVINFQLNSKKKELKTNISAAAHEALKDWLWADYRFYDHFKNKFMRERDAYGLKQLEHEREILARATEKVKERCIESEVDNNLLAKKDRLYGQGVMGYKMKENSDKDCPYYTMKEKSFVDEVRATQLQKSKKMIEKNNPGKSSQQVLGINSPEMSSNGIWAPANELDIETLKQRFRYKQPL